MAPVGYITDHYPAVSHTFIQREVLALRARGVDVRTFSIHRVGAEDILSRADCDAFETTYALLPPRLGHLAAAHMLALLRHRRAYQKALAAALQAPTRNPRARLWQLFYLTEAILLWWRCRRAGIRHVHAHFTSPAADTARLFGCFAHAVGAGGATWSFTAHGADIDDADTGMLAAKVRDADFVVCVSDYGRARLMALVDEDHWSKLHVVRCGVDVATFTPRAPRPDDATFAVLAVGRLVRVKGHGVLIEAIATLAREGLAVQATIVGDGPRMAALKRLAGRLRVADRVHFTGRVGQDDIGSYYAAADVFCLPSFLEGIPVVLMEAMASGLPVVASRITGIPELIESGSSGVLVPPGRPDALADALRSLANDSDLRTTLAAAGRERVSTEFEADTSARHLHALMSRYGVA